MRTTMLAVTVALLLPGGVMADTVREQLVFDTSLSYAELVERLERYFFQRRDTGRDGQIARHIQHRAAHIQQPIDAKTAESAAGSQPILPNRSTRMSRATVLSMKPAVGSTQPYTTMANTNTSTPTKAPELKGGTSICMSLRASAIALNRMRAVAAAVGKKPAPGSCRLPSGSALRG